MTNSQTPHSSLPTTLEELLARKNAVLADIRTQKARMNRLGKELAAPLTPAVRKGNGLLNAFDKGMAAFDGIMLGLKVMRRLKKLFRGKRRYRNF